MATDKSLAYLTDISVDVQNRDTLCLHPTPPHFIRCGKAIDEGVHKKKLFVLLEIRAKERNLYLMYSLL